MADRTSTTYHGAHYLVQKRRGLARRQSCIDCGRPARQWSYDHTDPNELTNSSGRQYSRDPDHYDPRCIACHRTFDRQHQVVIAASVQTDIKHAVIERDRARKYLDREAEDHWDDELERLFAPLKARGKVALPHTRR
jgi:hypothetical protein